LLGTSRVAADHLARRGERFLEAVCGAEGDVAAHGRMGGHEHDDPHDLRSEEVMGVDERPAAHIDGPLYTPGELGRYLLLPVATVHWWTLGRDANPALIHSSAPDENLLSFRNACEVHVLSALPWVLRRRVPLVVLSAIVRDLRERLKSEHPLADVRMGGEGKDIVTAQLRLAGLVPADDAFTALAVAAYAARIERDDRGEPIRLLVCTRGPDGPKHVTLDPFVNSGRPCITGTRIATASVWERFKRGTSLKRLAEKEGCSWEAVEEVVRYETGAP
jgi:uncharacterized protein (DUF433 family)